MDAMIAAAAIIAKAPLATDNLGDMKHFASQGLKLAR